MAEEKPWGCAMLFRPTTELRKLTKKERKNRVDNLLSLIEKYEKKGVKFFGSYGPILGTEYSTLFLFEFPDIKTFEEFRREGLDLLGLYDILKPLVGRKRSLLQTRQWLGGIKRTKE